MKFFSNHEPAHEKISAPGQWTLWDGRWSKVKHVSKDDQTAILLYTDYPVNIDLLDRYFKVLRPQVQQKALMKSTYSFPESYRWDYAYTSQFREEIVISDDHWMDFQSQIIEDKDFVRKETTAYGKFTTMAVPYDQGKTVVDITRLKERSPGNAKSGVEMVLDALHTAYIKTSPDHDDRFVNHELATTAMYNITKNTNLLAQTIRLPKRSKEQLLDDLAVAAATVIQEMDRVLRKKD